jgi:hypothetical protein
MRYFWAICVVIVVFAAVVILPLALTHQIGQ